MWSLIDTMYSVLREAIPDSRRAHLSDIEESESECEKNTTHENKKMARRGKKERNKWKKAKK